MRVRRALDDGEIVLLMCTNAGTIEDARERSRRATTWLHSLVGFPGLRVSRSATTGMGCVAAHQSRVVGVDIEQATAERVFDGMVEALLHSAEFDEVFGAPLRNETLPHVWARKEATLKAFGVGLAVSPNSIITGARDTEWRSVTHGILGFACVRSVTAPDGFAVAVAVLGATTATISVFDFE